MNLMPDMLYCGRQFRTLDVLDKRARECLGIEVHTSLQAGHVNRELKQLKQEHCLHEQISVNNGSEFITSDLIERCKLHRVELAHIWPGKPQQNGFGERCNGSFRREFMDLYLFETLNQMQDMAWNWNKD